jgi:A/G-specific adenine glycosylase
VAELEHEHEHEHSHKHEKEHELDAIHSSTIGAPTQQEESSLLLQDWMDHSDASYHNFKEEEATAIRAALQSWYRANRRKLPWRGDAPPYDGSTAGINNNIPKKRSTKTNRNSPSISKEDAKPTTTQSSITGFFSASSAKKGTRSTSKASSKPDECESKSKSTSTTISISTSTSTSSLATIPVADVSAYGVWVSEIMLQQTRVEAVIPYWIKCT